MQRRAQWAIVTAMGLGLGCGGGANTASPPSTAPAGSAPATAADAPAAPAASSPASTTTTAVGNAGGAPTKLADAPAPADSAGAVPKGHTHDPGRGTDDIRAIVVAHRDEARACYDHALLTHPGIEGDVVFKWTIDPKGAVTNVTLDQGRSKIAEPSVVSCITAIIQKLQFAASQGGFETKTSYPFNFHPHGKQ
jgi:hypothetical protein